MLPNMLLIENDTFTAVEKEHLRNEITEYKSRGYRLCSITCESLNEEEFELTYHLDLDYALVNLRLTGNYSEKVPSISPIFPSALLHENEYKDLFGIDFEDLLIDYKGNLYIAADGVKNPLR